MPLDVGVLTGTEYSVTLDTPPAKAVEMPVKQAIVEVQCGISMADPPSGPNPFTALSDAPHDYTGKGGMYLAVKSAENGIEFIPGGGGGGGGPVYWGDILDRPSFSAVATSGAYADLSGRPSIPATPADIGAARAAVTATVATARGTAAKVGATAGGAYAPVQGDTLLVTFTDGISVANPTLNIDGSGAKSIQLGKTNVTTNVLSITSQVIVPLFYDGTAYQMYGSQLNTNTTYTEISDAEITDPASTTARLVSGRRVAKALENVLKTNSPLATVRAAAGIVVCTQAEYDALTPDANTLYFIKS